jgi:hypothetical protein
VVALEEKKFQTPMTCHCHKGERWVDSCYKLLLHENLSLTGTLER